MKQLALIITVGLLSLFLMIILIWSTLHHVITKGIVVDKYTTEPRTVMTPIHAGKVTTYVPTHVSKKYHIVISGKAASGKEVQEDFTVTESDYERYDKGDQFDYNDVTNTEQD